MEQLFAMQRANGDWFALDDNASLRVPIFHSARDAQIARSRNWGMAAFKPVLFDDRVLQDLGNDGSDGGFWIVNDPLINLRRGLAIDFAQLVLLALKKQ